MSTWHALALLGTYCLALGTPVLLGLLRIRHEERQ